jgi:hypothetical protein
LFSFNPNAPVFLQFFADFFIKFPVAFKDPSMGVLAAFKIVLVTGN